MFNRLTLSSLLLLCFAICAAPKAIAQEEGSSDTRVEKYQELTTPEAEDNISEEELKDANVEKVEAEVEAEEAEAEAPTTRIDEYLPDDSEDE